MIHDTYTYKVLGGVLLRVGSLPTQEFSYAVDNTVYCGWVNSGPESGSGVLQFVRILHSISSTAVVLRVFVPRSSEMIFS